jgi:hypothetical protein
MKMMKWLGGVVVVGCAVTSSVALADTNAVTIETATIYMGSSYPGALVKISPAYPAGLGGCSYTTGNYVFIDFAAQVTPSGRDLYASVVAAFMAGHQVAFGTSGCSSDGAYPRASAINLLP